MKRAFISLFFIAVFLAGSNAKAQYGSDGQIIAGVNVGASLIGVLFSSISFADTDYWKSTNIPTLQINADYRMLDWLSIGGAFSYASTKVDYFDPNLAPIPDDDKLSDFKLNMNRFNVAVRTLAYFGNHEMIDLYSGVRIGANIWDVNSSSKDPDLKNGLDPLNGSFQGSFLGLQLILLGGTIYPVEAIGINFEFAVGQPYYAALGLRYRIGL